MLTREPASCSVIRVCVDPPCRLRGAEGVYASITGTLAAAGLSTSLFRQDVAALNLPFRYGAAILAAGSFQWLTDPMAAQKTLARIRAHLVAPSLLLMDLFIPAEAALASSGVTTTRAAEERTNRPPSFVRCVSHPVRASPNDIITVQAEACIHLQRTVHASKELGVKAGVTLTPATSLTTLGEILPDVDLVLIMSVNPGFGG